MYLQLKKLEKDSFNTFQQNSMLSTQSKWKYLHTRSIISWEHPFPCWPIQLATPAIMVAPAAPTVPAPTVVAPAILPVPRQVVTHDYVLPPSIITNCRWNTFVILFSSNFISPLANNCVITNFLLLFYFLFYSILVVYDRLHLAPPFFR